MLEIGDLGADILGRDIPAAERIHEAAVRAEELRRLVGRGIADDHGLAAAQVEARRGRLVGHVAGEPQHVGNRLVLGCERPHARAAERGAERRIVDRDDGREARIPKLAEDHLLVIIGPHLFEDLRHRRMPIAHRASFVKGIEAHAGGYMERAV